MPVSENDPAEEDDPRSRLLAFQVLLDGSNEASEKQVDLRKLRRLCSRGIPNHPPHLRPLAYTLLLDILPPEKAAWKSALLRRKTIYHTFMEELESQSTTSSSRFDYLLGDISRDTKKLKSSFWRRPTRPRRSSPFRAISHEDVTEGMDSSSPRSRHFEDSDTDDEEPSQPILSRRAIFKRLDMLSVAQLQGWPKKDEPKSAEDPSLPAPPDLVMLSPRITLSIESPPSILSRLEAVRPPPLDSHSLQKPSDNASCPIILLSPKPLLLSSSSSDFPLPISEALFSPEAHLEALIRLLYVSCLANPQWQYRSSLVDIAAHLYLVFAGGTSYSLSDVEEQVYWVMSALFKDMGAISSEAGIDVVLKKFEKRLCWFNIPLYSILQNNNIVPTLYGYRWFASIFTNDLPPASLTLLWDCILSEAPATGIHQSKVDFCIDIAVGMVLLVKNLLLRKHHVKQLASPPHNLWGEIEDEIEGLDESEDDLFVRCIDLLRHYPLQKIGGIWAVALEAYALKDTRLAAVSGGDDPDHCALPIAQAPPVSQRKADDTTWGKSIGSLWFAVTTATASKMTTTAPSANTVNTPATPHRNLILVAEHAASGNRGRSSSSASATGNSVSSLQERLAGFASNLQSRASPEAAASHTPSLPRPLLLSRSSRRESLPRCRRGSSASSRGEYSPGPGLSPGKTPPIDHPLSPPSARGSSPRGEVGGRYRLGNRHRSSLGLGSSQGEEICQQLDFEDAGTDKVAETVQVGDTQEG